MKVQITAQSVYGKHPRKMFTDKYGPSLRSMKTYVEKQPIQHNGYDAGIAAIEIDDMTDLDRLYRLVGFHPLKLKCEKRPVITVCDEPWEE